MNTYTTTYTTTDIRRVFENFEADLRMLVLRTGDKNFAWADNIAHDITLLAIGGYVKELHIQCLQSGAVTNVHKYTIETEIDWDSQRPGGNNWSRGSKLRILWSPSGKWGALTDSEKALIMRHMRTTWGASSFSTDYSHLREVGNRSYASSAYGLRRQTYERG